jgi:cytochrome b involved in lipid metabolism
MMEEVQLNENDSQDEINRLRREIERLSQAELGRSQASSRPSRGPCSASDGLAQVALPPRRPKKDLTIKEQPSNPPDKRKRKWISFAIGIILLAGAIAGVASLIKLMNKQDENMYAVPGQGGDRLVSSRELVSHNSASDCWVALHGDVYDLTAYAKRHPGGSSWITNLAGKDGTQSYSDFHSAGLLRSVQGNKIGPLDTSTANSDSSVNVDNNTGGAAGSTGATPQDCASDPSCVTTEDLARHNTASDCWVGLHGNVYDLTNYAKRHPGGARVLTQLAGIDGTSEYRRFHSSRLLQSVEGDLIGRLESSTSSNSGNAGNSNPANNPPPAEYDQDEDEGDEDEDD